LTLNDVVEVAAYADAPVGPTQGVWTWCLTLFQHRPSERSRAGPLSAGWGRV